jgi:hypothetical protein
MKLKEIADSGFERDNSVRIAPALPYVSSMKSPREEAAILSLIPAAGTTTVQNSRHAGTLIVQHLKFVWFNLQIVLGRR